MRKDLGEKKEIKEQKTHGVLESSMSWISDRNRAGQHVPGTGHKQQTWDSVIHISAKCGSYWGEVRKSVGV